MKDVAFEVEDLDELVKKAKKAGAEVVKDITIESDEAGSVRYAVLKTVSAYYYFIIYLNLKLNKYVFKYKAT